MEPWFHDWQCVCSVSARVMEGRKVCGARGSSREMAISSVPKYALPQSRAEGLL